MLEGSSLFLEFQTKKWWTSPRYKLFYEGKKADIYLDMGNTDFLEVNTKKERRSRPLSIIINMFANNTL